jgi:hypothetical protein
MDKEAFIRDLCDAPWGAAFVFDHVDEIVDAWYQWRSQPDNLVMLCKFEIIIIHFFTN